MYLLCRNVGACEILICILSTCLGNMRRVEGFNYHHHISGCGQSFIVQYNNKKALLYNAKHKALFINCQIVRFGYNVLY